MDSKGATYRIQCQALDIIFLSPILICHQKDSIFTNPILKNQSTPRSSMGDKCVGTKGNGRGRERTLLATFLDGGGGFGLHSPPSSGYMQLRYVANDTLTCNIISRAKLIG